MIAMTKTNILNMSQLELERWMAEQGLEKYRAGQIFQWLYQRSVFDFEKMTDLPKDLRRVLKKDFYSSLPEIKEIIRSEDLATKFLFELEDGARIEAVLIPDENEKENTLCVSSQVGCRFGCGFCRTGGIKFKRNLKTGEILGQYLAVRARLKHGEAIQRLVFMGMGEPLDNFEEIKKAFAIFTSRSGLRLSPRRITISTAGVTPLIPEVWSLGVNVAVSLNSADPEKRAILMPITRKYPLPDLIQTLKQLDTSGRQKLTAEYVMLKGFNDSNEHAFRLVRLLSGLKIMINLIRFNSFPGCEFEPSEEKQVLEFQEKLKQSGFLVFIRKSKGADILAGCGQLAGRKQ